MDSEIISLFGIDSEISSTSLTLDTYTATNRWQFLGAVNGTFGDFSIYKPDHRECPFISNLPKNLTDSEWDAAIVERTFGENIADTFDAIRGCADMVEAGYNGSNITTVVPDGFRTDRNVFTVFTDFLASVQIRILDDSTVSNNVGINRPGNAIYVRSSIDDLLVDSEYPSTKYVFDHGDYTSMCAGGIRNLDVYNSIVNQFGEIRVDSDALPRLQVTFRSAAPGSLVIPFARIVSNWYDYKTVSDADLTGYPYANIVAPFTPDRRRAHIVSVSLGRPIQERTYEQYFEDEADLVDNIRRSLYEANTLNVLSAGNAPFDASVTAQGQSQYIAPLAFGADSENTREHIIKTRSIAALQLNIDTSRNSGPSPSITIRCVGQYPGSDERWFQDIALGVDHEFTSKNRISVSGSSFTAPKIAGAAATLMSKYINISAALVAMSLKETGFNLESDPVTGVRHLWRNQGSRGSRWSGYRGPFTPAVFGNGLADVAAADRWIQEHCEFNDTRGYWVFKTTSMWHSRLTHEGYFIPAG